MLNLNASDDLPGSCSGIYYKLMTCKFILVECKLFAEFVKIVIREEMESSHEHECMDVVCTVVANQEIIPMFALIAYFSAEYALRDVCYDRNRIRLQGMSFPTAVVVHAC